MTTVMVVDDHSVVRMGLVTVLSRVPDLQVLGEAAGSAEALEKALTLRPELILMDVRLPDGSGIECCRAIRQQLPLTRVLMLTSYDDHDASVASLIAGASGYLLKHVEPADLLRAVKQVAGGVALWDKTVAESAVERLQLGMGEDELTERQRSILALVGEGLTNREIAARLSLSEKTVRNYVSLILEKLNLCNRSQAAVYVSKWQFLGGGERPF